MKDNNFYIKKPADDIICIPQDACRYLKNAGSAEMKLLVYSFANGEVDLAKAARELGLSFSEAESALAFWRGTGIIQQKSVVREKKAQETNLYQMYDSEVLSKMAEENSDYRQMTELVGEMIGKILNKNDYNSLFYLYDYVGLSAEFILGVTGYCVGIEKTSMQYIMKTALGLSGDGIDTYEALDEYFAKKEKTRSGIGRLRAMFGLGERALSPKEKKFFETWLEVWDMPEELIKLCYEKTVDSIGKISFSYMNSILKHWYENGFRTVSEVENGDKRTDTESSFDEDEFFRIALEKGMKC